MSSIKLQTSDGEVFEVDIEIAKTSILLKDMLDNLGLDPKDDEPIPLNLVSAATLRKVLQWATYHKDDPPQEECPIVSGMRDLTLNEWDRDFLKMDQTELFDIIVAANFLDIKSLFDASCKAVADMIRGKTPEEIRTTFGIQNDFTPEEEERIKKENSWSEEKPKSEEEPTTSKESDA